MPRLRNDRRAPYCSKENIRSSARRLGARQAISACRSRCSHCTFGSRTPLPFETKGDAHRSSFASMPSRSPARLSARFSAALKILRHASCLAYISSTSLQASMRCTSAQSFLPSVFFLAALRFAHRSRRTSNHVQAIGPSDWRNRQVGQQSPEVLKWTSLTGFPSAKGAGYPRPVMSDTALSRPAPCRHPHGRSACHELPPRYLH